jgi:hypothetical protein
MATQDNQNAQANSFDNSIPDPVNDDNELDLGPDNRTEMGYVGQLVQPGDGDVDEIDDEADAVALDEGFASYESQPAEEAAMHAVDDTDV